MGRSAGKLFDKTTGKLLLPKDGRVHAIITQVSFTEIGAIYGSGGSLDDDLQRLQRSGCEIMSVSCFASGDDSKYVQGVIVFRVPLEEK